MIIVRGRSPGSAQLRCSCDRLVVNSLVEQDGDGTRRRGDTLTGTPFTPSAMDIIPINSTR